MEHIGFIGLGNMGEPMAANVLAAGYPLTVYNRTAARAANLERAGARRVDKPVDTAQAGAIVITMVADDRALEEVVTGQDGFGARLGANGVHISMSTVSPDIARKLTAFHADHGSSYVAAPVFGRPNAAQARKLWIATSGPDAAKARVRSLLDAMGQGVYDFGADPTSAHIVKLCGNFMIFSAAEVMSEAFTLAQKNGIAREAFADMMLNTIFNTPLYNLYGKRIAEQDYTNPSFTLALALKDVDLMAGIARSSQTPTPIVSLLRDRALSGMAQGLANADATAIAVNMLQSAGIAPKH